MTLRTELKKQAGKQLAEMQAEIVKTADAVTTGSSLSSFDLMKSACSGRSATVEKKMISLLVSDAEAEILKQWNDQQELFKKETKEKL